MGRMGSLLCYILLRTSDKMPSFFCMDFSIFSVGGLAFLFKILYNLKCNTMLRRITMQIFLINAINGGVVHGTENGKKTGCGINLTKPDNIGKFVSGAPMQDIVDITCEKCKMVLAKKLIKESNKELARQLKEEKKMQKHGGMGAAPMGPISSAPTPPPAPARTSVAPPPQGTGSAGKGGSACIHCIRTACQAKSCTCTGAGSACAQGSACSG